MTAAARIPRVQRRQPDIPQPTAPVASVATNPDVWRRYCRSSRAYRSVGEAFPVCDAANARAFDGPFRNDRADLRRTLANLAIAAGMVGMLLFSVWAGPLAKFIAGLVS